MLRGAFSLTRLTPKYIGKPQTPGRGVWVEVIAVWRASGVWRRAPRPGGVVDSLCVLDGRRTSSCEEKETHTSNQASTNQDNVAA